MPCLPPLPTLLIKGHPPLQVQGTIAPYLKLLSGKVTLDASKLGSVSATIYTHYKSSSDFAVSIDLTATIGNPLGAAISMISGISSGVGDALNKIFSTISGGQSVISIQVSGREQRQ